MLNSIKSLWGKPVKNSNINPFSQTMQAIEDAKAQTGINADNNEQKYIELFNRGLACLKKFSNSNVESLNLLQKASEIFTEALEIKKNRPEPYFYLANIFLLINEVTLALKYIKIVTFLAPDFKGLEELRASITAKTTPVSTINQTPVKKPGVGTVTSISYKQFIKPKTLQTKLSAV